MSASSVGSVVEPPIANHYDGRLWVEADRYTELLAKYATLTAETRWIPVTERLPDDGSKVLGHDPQVCEEDSVSVVYFHAGRWIQHDYHTFEPTHWMPLPAQPQR